MNETLQYLHTALMWENQRMQQKIFSTAFNHGQYLVRLYSIVVVVVVAVAFNLGKYPVHLYLIGQQRAGHQMQAVANIKAVELVPMLNVSAGVTLQVLHCRCYIGNHVMRNKYKWKKFHNRHRKYQSNRGGYNVKCQHSR